MAENNGGEKEAEAAAKEKQPKKHGMIKVKENSSQAAVNFFTEGIVTEKLKEGRYFNSISLVKLIVVEPFYVTLQMFPTFQILCLTSIQLAYFVYFCKMAFKQKIFISKLKVSEVMINEIAILCFLTIGLLFQLSGGIQNLSQGFSTALQIVGIVFLGLSCILGAGTIIVSFANTAYQIIKTRRNKKMREIYQKEVCGKKTEEVISEDAPLNGLETGQPKVGDKDSAKIGGSKPTENKNDVEKAELTQKKKVERKREKRLRQGLGKKDLVILPGNNGGTKATVAFGAKKQKGILGLEYTS